MVRRTGRSDWPADHGGTMRALSFCRDAMIDVLRSVKPMGPVYHGASMVVAAIDAFAQLLTGERYHFSAEGSRPAGPGGAEPVADAQTADGSHVDMPRASSPAPLHGAEEDLSILSRR